MPRSSGASATTTDTAAVCTGVKALRVTAEGASAPGAAVAAGEQQR